MFAFDGIALFRMPASNAKKLGGPRDIASRASDILVGLESDKWITANNKVEARDSPWRSDWCAGSPARDSGKIESSGWGDAAGFRHLLMGRPENT